MDLACNKNTLNTCVIMVPGLEGGEGSATGNGLTGALFSLHVAQPRAQRVPGGMG
jgi:hypothetical protein